MGRTPCCENMGVRKGPWTPEEDQILISHIKRFGHGNWRAIPRQAGLFRCGKSCRLRWSNYLKPGVKRGNFTKEEEDAIISLHAALGSRWSAIAANLPGRTDNEIKNLWHSHLKKRFDPNQVSNRINGKESRQQQQKKKKHDGHDHVFPAACSSCSGAAADISFSYSEINGENCILDYQGGGLFRVDCHEVLVSSGKEEVSRAEAFDPVTFFNGERQSFWTNLLEEATNMQD